MCGVDTCAHVKAKRNKEQQNKYQIIHRTKKMTLSKQLILNDR